MPAFQFLPVCLALLLSIWASCGNLCLGAEPIFAAPAESGTIPAGAPEPSSLPSQAARAQRILLIVPADCDRCQEELEQLSLPGGTFAALRQQGWSIGPGPENQVQILHRSQPVEPALARFIQELNPLEAIKVVAIEDNQVIRAFQRGCTTPLDQWTFGWLMTGNDERPVDFVPEPVTVPTTGNYRLRGNHWSVEGNFNPTREEVARHLRAIHATQMQADWKIEDWSIDELKSLHDDLHEKEEGFRSRYTSTHSARPSSNSQSTFRKPGNAAR